MRWWPITRYRLVSIACRRSIDTPLHGGLAFCSCGRFVSSDSGTALAASANGKASWTPVNRWFKIASSWLPWGTPWVRVGITLKQAAQADPG